jgi:hypothetical protein
MPNDKIVSTRNLNQLLTNENYKKYYELKKEILKDYPIQKLRTREQHRECMKRIGDLMWDINGDFQKFIDSQISEIIVTRQEQKGNPKKAGRKYEYDDEDYY